jgi:tetratricopeptide (TPR) repeat protein
MKPHGSMKDYLKIAVQRRPRVLPCLDQDQLVEFYLGRLEESKIESIRDHLAECPDCLDLAHDVRQFLAVMREPIDSAQAQPAEAPSPIPIWHGLPARKLLLLAASLVIAVGAGLLLWRGSRVESPPEPQAQAPPATPSTTTTPENPWRDLQIAKAQYLPGAPPQGELIWRDDSPRAPEQRPRGSFARAMQPYERNNFAEAERQLGQFVEKNPKYAAAHFYRGVSLLLLGKTVDAVAPLEAAVANGRGRVREEAHWYLALSYLKTGDQLKALEQLDGVIQTSGRHRADAEQLRQQVKQFLDQGAKPSLKQ